MAPRGRRYFRIFGGRGGSSGADAAPPDSSEVSGARGVNGGVLKGKLSGVLSGPSRRLRGVRGGALSGPVGVLRGPPLSGIRESGATEL